MPHRLPKVVHGAPRATDLQGEDVPQAAYPSCSLLFKSVNNTDFKKQLLIRSIAVLAR